MILLLSCLLSVASAFTPGASPSHNKRQLTTTTPLDNAFCYDDCVPPSILHPLNEMGVDLDDDDMDIISKRGWVDYAINKAQMTTVEQRPKTSKTNEGLEEIVISFSPVALLIILEIIMAEAHSNGGTIFTQTMFH